jgi:hypothetical protein
MAGPIVGTIGSVLGTHAESSLPDSVSGYDRIRMDGRGNSAVAMFHVKLSTSPLSRIPVSGL